MTDVFARITAILMPMMITMAALLFIYWTGAIFLKKRGLGNYRPLWQMLMMFICAAYFLRWITSHH